MSDWLYDRSDEYGTVEDPFMETWRAGRPLEPLAGPLDESLAGLPPLPLEPPLDRTLEPPLDDGLERPLEEQFDALAYPQNDDAMQSKSDLEPRNPPLGHADRLPLKSGLGGPDVGPEVGVEVPTPVGPEGSGGRVGPVRPLSSASVASAASAPSVASSSSVTSAVPSRSATPVGGVGPVAGGPTGPGMGGPAEDGRLNVKPGTVDHMMLYLQAVQRGKQSALTLDAVLPPPGQANGGIDRRPTDNTPPLKFVCEYEGCNKSFRQRMHLETHMRSHTGERPYKCPYAGCNKAFSQVSNMKTHMRSHSGEKPFACSICGRCFAQRGNLASHLRLHERSAKYECRLDGCKKTFHQLGNLKNHHNSSHAETVARLTDRIKAQAGNLSVPALSAEDREMFTYFCSLYRNANRGIKGRGKGTRAIQLEPPAAPTSSHVSAPAAVAPAPGQSSGQAPIHLQTSIPAQATGMTTGPGGPVHSHTPHTHPAHAHPAHAHPAHAHPGHDPHAHASRASSQELPSTPLPSLAGTMPQDPYLEQPLHSLQPALHPLQPHPGMQAHPMQPHPLHTHLSRLAFSKDLSVSPPGTPDPQATASAALSQAARDWRYYSDKSGRYTKWPADNLY